METPAAIPSYVPLVKFLINLASALCGIVGAWLMARRYARQPLISIILSLGWPVFFIFRKNKRVQGFVTSEFKANSDIRDSPVEMALGLSLVFWAFLLQAVGLLIELRH